MSKTHENETRIVGLLRSVQSASFAVAYGTSSVKSFAHLGSASLNFALWGVALLPTWLVVRRIGVDLNGPNDEVEAAEVEGVEDAEAQVSQVAQLPKSGGVVASEDEKKK